MQKIKKFKNICSAKNEENRNKKYKEIQKICSGKNKEIRNGEI